MKEKSQIEVSKKTVKELKEAYIGVMLVDKIRQKNLLQEECTDGDWPAKEDALKTCREEYQKAYRNQKVTITMICHIIDSCNQASIEYVKEIYNTFDNHSEPKKVALKKLMELYKQILIEVKTFQSAEILYRNAPKSTKIKLYILEKMFKLAKTADDYQKVYKLAPPSHELKKKSMTKIESIRKGAVRYNASSSKSLFSYDSIAIVEVE